ncbi:MAG TPA: RNA 2',3'-cyclic phosphodiesterase [bacterium]|nr:RNA 2',3'-cyclic phosphodiesterase [bacterium]HPR86439.1 RNA 2',3'-cyclic phosphodiesterase [bacterium]
MATLRTFICIELPVEIRTELAALQNRLKAPGSGVSWTHPEGIHLTLKFLGDVEAVQMEAIAGAVARACQGTAAFKITVSGTGAFPQLARPRVLWVGIEERSGQLNRVQAQIESELSALGYPREARRFSPHLTLGRVKSPEAVQGICREMQAQGFAPVHFIADSVVVMRSDLRPDGALYTPLKRIEL